jgi:hypothetical protein
MQRVPVPMCFKGSRTYLHGTDLYNALCEKVPRLSGLPVQAPVRIVIHRLVTHECDILLGAVGESIEKPERPWAEFTFSTDQGMIAGWMCETDRDVACRYEYAEERIEVKSALNDSKKEIVIHEDTGYSPVEVAVAMTKKMHNAMCPTKAKWLFTRLELKRLLQASDAHNLRIRLEHNFNNRLTKSSLLSDGEAIGYIYFSLLTQ